MSITTSTRRMTADEQMCFELGKKQGFHWGVNYYKALIEQNTPLDEAYDKTMKLANQIPDGGEEL